MPALVDNGTQGAPNFSALLQRFYVPGIREAVSNLSKMHTLCTKNTKDVKSNTATIALHVGRNGAVGPGTERGSVRPAGRQGHLQVEVPTKKVWAPFEISAELQAAARDSKTAFGNSLQIEMKGLATDVVNYFDRTMASSDGTGRLATLLVPTAGYPAGTSTFELADARDAIYLETNLQVDLFQHDTNTFIARIVPTTDSDRFEITSVNLQAGTFTISPAITVAIPTGADVSVSIADTISTGSRSFIPFATGQPTCIQGIRSIVNNTPLFGVNPAQQPKFAAISANGAMSAEASPDAGATQGRFIEQNVEFMLDLMRTNGSPELPDIILTSMTQTRHYQRQLRVERRQPATIALKSGREVMYQVYRGKKIAIDDDVFIRNGESFGWRKEDLVLYESLPLDWFKNAGSILHPFGGGSMVRGLLFTLCELAPFARNNMVFKTDWSQTG